MSVLIRRAKEMLMTPEEYARTVAFIARNNRRAKEALLKEEKRLLRILSRPADGPPAPYRAPGRPVFFTSGWKTVTAEVIEAMAEDDAVNDLILNLVDPLEDAWDDGLEARIDRRRSQSLACDPTPRRKTPGDRQFRGPQRFKYAA